MNKSEIIYVPEEGYSFTMKASTEKTNLSGMSERERDIILVRANYGYWNSMSNFKSSNNYDDENFRQIVQMGEAAIPGILEIIQDHPDPIVHALDLILPNHVEYFGLVSLEDVCKSWILTLYAIGKY